MSVIQSLIALQQRKMTTLLDQQRAKFAGGKPQQPSRSPESRPASKTQRKISGLALDLEKIKKQFLAKPQNTRTSQVTQVPKVRRTISNHNAAEWQSLQSGGKVTSVTLLNSPYRSGAVTTRDTSKHFDGQLLKSLKKPHQTSLAQSSLYTQMTRQVMMEL